MPGLERRDRRVRLRLALSRRILDGSSTLLCRYTAVDLPLSRRFSIALSVQSHSSVVRFLRFGKRALYIRSLRVLVSGAISIAAEYFVWLTSPRTGRFS